MKNKTLTYLIPVLILVSLLAGACTTVPNANAQPTAEAGNLRTIAVTGTGEIILVPDMAYINIGVHTEAEDVSSAVANNNRQANDIIEAIAKLGIEEKDIQTSNFNVYTMNNYDNMGNATGTSFSVDNTLYIIVRDLPKLSEILDAALVAGANQIFGINFDIADRQAALDRARDLAIEDAQNKAQAVATTIGATLGKIQSVYIVNNSYVQSAAGYQGGMGAADSAVPSVPISAGQIVVNASADLVFAFGD
jgi:uncharacterized protein YggE